LQNGPQGIVEPLARTINPSHTSQSERNQGPLQLNASWRVIACRGGIQWILQYRNRTETVARDDWRGRAYCRTKEALILCCDRYCGEIDPAAAAALQALPERIEPGTGCPAPLAFGEVRA
jgi:hypothetical protein